MTTVLLFHHAHGQTPGFLAFAEDLRAAGHTVHTPDLYEGSTFADLDEGVAHAGSVGFGEIIGRGTKAAEDLPTDIVYAGFSLGVLPAQSLAQTRPGARGALLFSGCVPPSEFGGPWPESVPLQIHMMDADPWGEEDGLPPKAGQGSRGRGAVRLPRLRAYLHRARIGGLRRAGGRAAHGAHARVPGSVV